LASSSSPNDDRLRRPPSERFAGDVHVYSLRDALAKLRAEDHPARDGHRQITLLHRPPVTQVLFSFAAGGHLDQHSASGLVTIHVIEGRLRVAAGGADHELEAGRLIVLDADVPHDVRAVEASAMLLTVHLIP
jgi:quercetin dioxygenase-like cupin family protein